MIKKYYNTFVKIYINKCVFFSLFKYNLNFVYFIIYYILINEHKLSDI